MSDYSFKVSEWRQPGACAQFYPTTKFVAAIFCDGVWIAETGKCGTRVAAGKAALKRISSFIEGAWA